MRTKILNLIEKNSKLEVRDMAAMLGETDEERVTALIEVKVTPQRGEGFDKVAERVYNFEEVTSLYLMSGGFDITVIIEGKTLKEVSRFVSRKLAPMESVISTSTHFVLKKYKEHGTKLVTEKKVYIR